MMKVIPVYAIKSPGDSVYFHEILRMFERLKKEEQERKEALSEEDLFEFYKRHSSWTSVKAFSN